MKLQEQHYNTGNEYAYRVLLDFGDLETNLEFEIPVQGQLIVDLTDEFPYPVKIDIKSDMVCGDNDDATYVEFDRLHHTVEHFIESPIEFNFITKSASPSERFGGKVYSFTTSEHDPEADIDPFSDPEFIEHHIKIPSSERVRTIASISDKITSGDGEVGEILTHIDLIYSDFSSPVEEFYDDIKDYADFETIIQILGFFVETGHFSRTHSDTVNKVAKQVTKERLRSHIQSIDDIERFVSIINSEDSLPDITVQEVFNRVYERTDGNQEELEKIAKDLDVSNWHSLI